MYRTCTCWDAHSTVPDTEASLQRTSPTMPPDNGVMPPACQPGSSALTLHHKTGLQQVTAIVRNLPVPGCR